jgi:hypothetical protein
MKCSICLLRRYWVDSADGSDRDEELRIVEFEGRLGVEDVMEGTGDKTAFESAS